MSTSKHIDKICIAAVALMLVLTVLFMNGKKLGIKALTDEEDDGYFSRNDLLSDWDTTDATVITLSDDASTVKGNGAYVKNGDIRIAYAGKYVVSGSLSNGKIVIDADGDDKIRLMLSGVDISCEDNAAILIEQADKVFLTLADGTENTLSSGKIYSDEAQKSKIDGVIYSRDDLTINGNGTLCVSGEYAHGIVCNDSLKITAGNISVSANEDAIHANDCVCIKEATLDLKSGDDGITVSNDEQTDYMYIESGDIKITGCYEGLEATTVTIAGGNIDITPTDDGINAEKLIEISGGSVKIVNENGRDADGLDSNMDIVISGGKLFISVSQSGGSCAIDYGSENRGQCRIDGGTVIACGSNTMLEEISTNSKQAFIMKNVSGNANTDLTLTSTDGTELISETIPAAFSAITLSMSELKLDDVCTFTVGETTQEITVDSTSETGGNGFGGGGMGGRGGFDRGGMDDRKDMPGQNENDGNNPPKMPNGSFQPGEDNTPPQMPDGNDQPGGGNTPPQKPNGNFSGSDMPGGQNGTPPEMPNDNNQGRPQIPNGEQGKGASGQFDPFSGDKQNPNGQREKMQTEDNGKTDLQNKKQTNNFDASTWVLIAVSIIVLAGGLFVAFKKKY